MLLGCSGAGDTLISWQLAGPGAKAAWLPAASARQLPVPGTFRVPVLTLVTYSIHAGFTSPGCLQQRCHQQVQPALGCCLTPTPEAGAPLTSVWSGLVALRARRGRSDAGVS